MKDFKGYYSAKYNPHKIQQGNYCGLLFKAKYIDKSIFIPPSDSMREGIYFEFLATGALPRDGKIPIPDRTQKGELTAPYKRAEQAAVFFKKLIEHYKIKILEKGYVVQNDDIIGTIDILAEWDGIPVIIDLKYTGLIDDKWNDLGWNTDNLPTKDNLMIQGVHYILLGREVLGQDMPFFYFIFNNKDSEDVKIIKQQNDEDIYERHKADVESIKNLIEEEIKEGFKAFPYYRNCKDCPIKLQCDKKELYPSYTTVYYGESA